MSHGFNFYLFAQHSFSFRQSADSPIAQSQQGIEELQLTSEIY